jgi:acyl-CoA synthetase (AMP-forming)/AMP-acid ligase II
MRNCQTHDSLWPITAASVGAILVLVSFHHAIRLGFTLLLVGTIPATFGLILIGMAVIMLKLRSSQRRLEARLDALEAKNTYKANNSVEDIVANRAASSP